MTNVDGQSDFCGCLMIFRNATIQMMIATMMTNLKIIWVGPWVGTWYRSQKFKQTIPTMMGLLEKTTPITNTSTFWASQNICIHVETTGSCGWNVFFKGNPPIVGGHLKPTIIPGHQQNHLDKGNPSKLSYPSNISWFDAPTNGSFNDT